MKLFIVVVTTEEKVGIDMHLMNYHFARLTDSETEALGSAVAAVRKDHPKLRIANTHVWAVNDELIREAAKYLKALPNDIPKIQPEDPRSRG